jgi:sulfur transfer complex TusBCD TusB component (DsrH family)
MKSAYVQLNRRFSEVDKGQSELPLALIDRLGDGKTWEDLTPVESTASLPGLDVVVILASSGSGKTAELEARSATLRASDLDSFFLRATDIAARGWNGAIAIDDRPRFESWLDSDERSVFFIDAIDEVRLLGLDLQSVLRFVRNEVVAQARGAVRLVISSRNDLWAKNYERQIADVLTFGGRKANVRSFNLMRLSLADVRCYVEAQGVADVDAFMAAFEEEELYEVSGHRRQT